MQPTGCGYHKDCRVDRARLPHGSGSSGVCDDHVGDGRQVVLHVSHLGHASLADTDLPRLCAWPSCHDCSGR